MNIFIKTAIMALVIFIAGLAFGLVIGEEKISSLESEVISLNSDLNDIELQFLLMDVMGENLPCDYFLSEAERLGSATDSMGREVERYEQSDRLSNKDFVLMKQKYTSMLIRNWLTLEKIKSACDCSYVTVLYFYDLGNCDGCINQGLMLSYLKDKLDGDIMVFAIDAGIGLRTTTGLIESYGVDEYPTLVINGEKYEGFYDLEQLTGLLCEKNSNLSIC